MSVIITIIYTTFDSYTKFEKNVGYYYYYLYNIFW